jgi:NurA-like 5'-3' nuclease
MSTPNVIQVGAQLPSDSATIIAARIGLITAILGLAAGILALLGSVITLVASSTQAALEGAYISKVEWKQFARKNGWIPKSECDWDSRETTGQDNSGREIKVRIHLLSGEYRWVLNSSSKVELGNVETNLALHIHGLELDSKSDVVVAIGMASVEGNFAEQSILAEERTDRLIRLIKDELKPDIQVHGLSLGRYIDESTKSNSRVTASQRRVVVIEVFEPQKGVILEQAVYDALIEAAETSPRIPFNVRNYKDRKYTNHSFGRK